MQLSIPGISFRNLLKLSVFTVFMGRAYHFLFWDVPFRSLLWDESLMKPLVEFFNSDWNDYVSSVQLDNGIKFTSLIFGIVFLFAALLVWKKTQNRYSRAIIFAGGIGLFILGLLLLKSRFYRIGQFFEYSIQIGIPFLFIYYHSRFVQRYLILILKILIALTFSAHGLYAIGYYPVPGHFMAMVIDILGFGEQNAKLFLLIAGVLDFMLAIGLFIPRITRIAVVYAIVWGTLTALARIVAGFDTNFFWELLHLNGYQVVYRLSHGLIPLALLVALNARKDRLQKNM